jgi:hypothetical protein
MKTIMAIERRKKRSSDPIRAAELYFEASRRQARAKAVALAGDDGLVISGSGPNDVVAEIAALASSRARGGDPLHSAAIEIDGMQLRLTSLGGTPIPVREASAAISRILFAA